MASIRLRPSQRFKSSGQNVSRDACVFKSRKVANPGPGSPYDVVAELRTVNGGGVGY